MSNKISILILFTLLLAVPLFSQDVTLKVGDEPPELDFKLLTDSAGQNPQWRDFEGQVVVIDFWATWCLPCRKSFPHLNQLVEELKNKPVSFVSITYEPAHMVEPFLQKYPLNTTIGLDNDFAMFKSYKAWGIPIVVIVNQKGRIASVIHPDYLSKQVILDVLDGKTPDVKQAEGWPDPEGAFKYFKSLVKEK